MYRFVTQSMISHAKAVLMAPPDDSKANEQARAAAKETIQKHIDNLLEFLEKNPNSPLSLNLELQIKNLKSYLK